MISKSTSQKFMGAALVLGLFPAASVLAAEASIKTIFASYGYAAERKDAKDDIAKLCDGKAACQFLVKSESFTSKQPVDPSPGNDKGLMVSWSCGDVTHKTQFAEGRNATLDCK